MSGLRGEQVTLRLCSGDDERDLVAGWLGSALSVYATVGPELLRPADARAVLDAAMVLLVEPSAGAPPVGATWWQRGGHGAGYVVDCAVGDVDAWRAGAGADALATTLGYLFHSAGAHRVAITVGTFNEPLAAAVAACGMSVEGVLRDHHVVDGGHADAVVCSLLRPEFYAVPGRAAAADRLGEEEKLAARRLLAAHLDAGAGGVWSRITG